MADKSTRDQAVKAVRAYFADNLRINTLSRLDLDKLNMGIFFCLNSLIDPQNVGITFCRLLDVGQTERATISVDGAR